MVELVRVLNWRPLNPISLTLTTSSWGTPGPPPLTTLNVRDRCVCLALPCFALHWPSFIKQSSPLNHPSGSWLFWHSFSTRILIHISTRKEIQIVKGRKNAPVDLPSYFSTEDYNLLRTLPYLVLVLPQGIRTITLALLIFQLQCTNV